CRTPTPGRIVATRTAANPGPAANATAHRNWKLACKVRADLFSSYFAKPSAHGRRPHETVRRHAVRPTPALRTVRRARGRLHLPSGAAAPHSPGEANGPAGGRVPQTR